MANRSSEIEVQKNSSYIKWRNIKLVYTTNLNTGLKKNEEKVN